MQNFTKVPISEPTLGVLERSYLIEAFDSGWISSLGPFVSALPDLLNKRLGSSFSTSVSNGTAALHLALLALGIGDEDEVIVPDLSFVAVPNSVLYVGATPVFVDIEPVSLGLDLDEVRHAIGPKTKAIIAVHNYGFVGDIRALRELANDHGIFLIEDCAEASFHSSNGLATGSLGDVAIFSFFGNKVITSGEGGAITARSEGIIERINFLKNQSAIVGRRFEFEEIGYNFRMTNLQAAILSAQLENLDKILDRRYEIFKAYSSAFYGLPNLEAIKESEIYSVSPWLYSLGVSLNLTKWHRDDLIKHLEKLGIETRPYFQPHSASGRFRVNRENFQTSNSISERFLNIPTYGHMSDDQIEHVVKAVLSWKLS